ncbi:MAG: hypothetical protein I3273_02885 [Candidatus Moeniiplasma glomeromycotorum]|nr:hypothetical protein [Candidatus Moeniiplasma glomeromycotorum]MCE8167599.1 hypothetical protein [Candidatus Moeniiplasma glomeromycotorum]MCE8169051.1 hypothetical protein [Candidatus Moeniiplasma glomeromycotorum]
MKQEIEENKRKAASEVDPEKKKKLKIANLGNDFNPNRHINDFIKSIENSLGGGTAPKKDPFSNSSFQLFVFFFK